MTRHGTILIIVAGLASILLVLSVSLISRSREEARASSLVMQEAQARMMLHAASQYVLESARLGYDDLALPTGHPQRTSPLTSGIIAREAFGWVDIRGPLADPASGDVDAIGPKDMFGYRLYDPTPIDPTVPSEYLTRWPAPGSVARCPMYRKTVPPYAISPQTVTNPLVFERGGNADYTRWADFSNRWPTPMFTQWSNTSSPTDPGYFATGIPTPVSDSLGQSWFRVYREVEQDHNGVDDAGYSYDDATDIDTVDLSGHHGIFIVTCGAGATDGFRNWAEVQALGATAQFGSETAFLEFQQTEQRMWYRIEYNAATGTDEYVYRARDANYLELDNSTTNSSVRVNQWDDHWKRRFDKDPSALPTTDTITPTHGTDYIVQTVRNFNPLGTILWTQRITREPPRW
ncbi:MAG: hypothetical protein PF961_10995 [Planctomycetota bacterium]|jgi:hypothetical protein|nr:hypothetical protein [Planctomycetota bacterium]